MRPRTVLLVVLVGVLAVGSIGPSTGATSPDHDIEQLSDQPFADTELPDPPGDPLGWENGYWYNESIDVTPEDGLNDSELDTVVARSMARVEYIRGIEFNETVPVEVISRAEFSDSRSASNATTSTANRIHQNVKWEAMLSIGEDENALSSFQSTQTATIGGYYSPSDDRIVIVSENATTPKMDEITLSQELFHALQDQQLEISFDRSTREGLNAGNGIIEGDGNLVDQLYQSNCGDDWDCVTPSSDDSSGGGDTSGINYGIYLTQYQPYNDGPTFVSQIYSEAGSWDAVNDVYDNPPTSTEQVIHPEKYPDEGPLNITFTDSSSDEWYVPDLGNGSVDYARFGQAGLSAMFLRPVIATQYSDVPVLNRTQIFSDGRLNYGLDVTDGWGNDRLYPYATDESAETNETGYVWQIEWDTVDDAGEFADGYAELLEYYGAEPVPENESTYRVPDTESFGDAFYIGHDGQTVTIVNGPTVDDLSEIRAGVAPANETTVDSLADPKTDRLGWENGVWHNESIDVTAEDGLNETELDLVVARGMARVEHVRQLEFEETPPVEVISRNEFREEASNIYSNVTESQRLAANIYYEALLMVDQSTDAVSVQQSNTAGGTGGYYDPESGEIKIVSENTTTPQMDEVTLSQELFHALQDQQFNISSFDQSTQELHNAKDGIIEGDGNYVDHLYQQACENEWGGECIMPEEGDPPSDFEPHLGLYQIKLQPYSDGPAFVRTLHEEQGWQAVNAVYESPPASTEQTIHPDKYGVDEPTNVTVTDASSADWQPLAVENGTDYQSFGEAGLYVTLWYPGYEILTEDGNSSQIIIPYRNHVNQNGQPLDLYNYDHPYIAGWDGDKLVPYVTNETAEIINSDDPYELGTLETGYVYKLAWDTESDAAEFIDGYEQLLEYHGAQPVSDADSTYIVPDYERFGDAFYVEHDGKTVTIVNAPTVEDLSAIYAGAVAPNGTDSNATTTDTDKTTTDTGDGSGPGFSVVAALIALLASAAVAVRRRR